MSEKRIRKSPKKFAHKEKEKTVIRRVRCHQCEGCSRENCNKCRFCLDMKKNGGEGKLRQSCAMRFCKNVSILDFLMLKMVSTLVFVTSFPTNSLFCYLPIESIQKISIKDTDRDTYFGFQANTFRTELIRIDIIRPW